MCYLFVVVFVIVFVIVLCMLVQDILFEVSQVVIIVYQVGNVIEVLCLVEFVIVLVSYFGEFYGV